MLFYKVFVTGKIWGTMGLLTYASTSEIFNGTIVDIPYGKENIILKAIVFEQVAGIDFDKAKLKEIVKIYSCILHKGYINNLLKTQAVYSINIAPFVASPVAYVCKHYEGYNFKDFVNPPMGSKIKKLIFGLPGTGKTFNMLKEIHPSFKTIYIVPNKAMISIIASKLDRSYLIYHSGLTSLEKRGVFNAVLENKYTFIIGTRSLLFLPFVNLDNVIIDEFHDNSLNEFKSITFYKSTDIVETLVNSYGANGYYISATPTLEYWLKIRDSKWGTFTEHKLKNDLIPITYVYGNHNQLEKSCVEQVQDFINKKEKFLIIINRKGYGSSIRCIGENCSNKPLKCKKCKVNLTYYRSNGKLMCNMCREDVIIKCFECDSPKLLKMMSVGVERIGTLLKENIPKIKVSLLTSDLVVNSNVVNHISDLKKVHGIIGTSIVQQGLHHKSIKNVIIFDTSIGFLENLPNQRILQISDLIQGVGRVFNNKGRAFIYSYTKKPEDKWIQNCDLTSIYENELSRAKNEQLPPYAYMYQVYPKHLEVLTKAGIIYRIIHHGTRDNMTYITSMLPPAKIPIDNYKIISLKTV